MWKRRFLNFRETVRHMSFKEELDIYVNQINTMLENTMNVNTGYADYLMEAANYVNEKQQTSSDMAEKLVLDPDSVDVHDVTIVMAEANLSLSIAQNVIERLTKAWSEITTTR